MNAATRKARQRIAAAAKATDATEALVTAAHSALRKMPINAMGIYMDKREAKGAILSAIAALNDGLRILQNHPDWPTGEEQTIGA